ncbi:MAG TPA: flagellar protein FlbB [Xanthobacteraceae bacterium]|jgi:flagellar motility protein MotE (MotC chaperone)|nr:flagellar protein FlbB [Xanthobacteraceae bacterium]
MMRFVRDLRLIPIALVASACLLALKTADLVLSGSSFLSGNAASGFGDVAVIRPAGDATQPSGMALSWAQQMFSFPNSSGATPVPSPQGINLPRLAETDSADITGSVTAPAGQSKPAGEGAAAPDGKTMPAAALGKDGKPVPLQPGTIIRNDTTMMPSGAERAILERLQERRQELDTRTRELDMRENLIKSAEKRIDARVGELKETEERIKTELQQKNDVEAVRLKGLVTMYESMKPRDAAKIFNGLDGGVLLDVASAINPRTMAEIMAQMSPDAAQHLTVELASKAQQSSKGDSTGELPKIQGQSAAQSN